MINFKARTILAVFILMTLNSCSSRSVGSENNFALEDKGEMVSTEAQIESRASAPVSSGIVGKPNGDPISCLKEIGREKATELVKLCSQVSPATHPPCNAENRCALIESEIERGCEYGKGNKTVDALCRDIDPKADRYM